MLSGRARAVDPWRRRLFTHLETVDGRVAVVLGVLVLLGSHAIVVLGHGHFGVFGGANVELAALERHAWDRGSKDHEWKSEDARGWGRKTKKKKKKRNGGGTAMPCCEHAAQMSTWTHQTGSG